MVCEAGLDASLFVDLYELKMVQAYFDEEMRDEAVFSLFVRRLPPRRSYLVAAGLESVLGHLESLRFTRAGLDYLERTRMLSNRLLRWLEELHFTGDVFAVPEGTPVFAGEPILEVVAPICEAQLVETLVMNQIHVQTVIASKVSRLVQAAAGRDVIDYGARRTHGLEAALDAARAGYIAGMTATSNVLAGMLYGIPISGTMAHSYIEAHDDEMEAFRAFTRIYPDTVLLVDTYDTLAGVQKVIELARELGDAFRVRALRLDSGDLEELARRAREMLDAAGLRTVELFVSGSLDEEIIAAMVRRGAPVSGFGVGTDLGVSPDAPALDMAYKLASYAGRGRLKLSTGKQTLPGRKQVFRQEKDGWAVRDLLAREEERLAGRPLLRHVMRRGVRVEPPAALEHLREQARRELALLPPELRGVEPAEPPYPVELSEALRSYLDETRREVAGAAS